MGLPGPLGLYWASRGPRLDLSGPLWPSPGPLLGFRGALLGCIGLLLELFCNSSGLISSSLEPSMRSILHLQSFYHVHQQTRNRTVGIQDFVRLFWPSKWFLFLGPKSLLCDDFLKHLHECAETCKIENKMQKRLVGGCLTFVYHTLLVPI